MCTTFLILSVWATVRGWGGPSEAAELQENVSLLRLGNVHVGLQPLNQLFTNEFFHLALTDDFVEPPSFPAPSVLTRLVKTCN